MSIDEVLTATSPEANGRFPGSTWVPTHGTGAETPNIGWSIGGCDTASPRPIGDHPHHGGSVLACIRTGFRLTVVRPVGDRSAGSCG
jgi:hypothetical protein